MEYPSYVDPATGRIYTVTEFMIDSKSMTQFYLYEVKVEKNTNRYNGYMGDEKGPRHVSLTEAEYFSLKSEAEHILNDPADLDLIIPPVTKTNGGILVWEKTTSLSAFMVQ